VLALSQQFQTMVREKQGQNLPIWHEVVAESGIRPLIHFAQGLKADLAAVSAALTLPWSNGVTEGHVNRLKMIKRQMYGRANFDLLRKRVLLL
jgi:transposase